MANTKLLPYKIIREILRVIKQLFVLLNPKLYKDIYLYFTFPSWSYRGKFKTFKEAKNAYPKDSRNHIYESKKTDLEAITKEMQTKQINNTEYPVFLWLKIIAESFANKSTPLKILDFGGNYGVHYFSFTNTLKIVNPQSWILTNLQWQVIEKPQIAEQGNIIANSLQINNLHFSCDLLKANNHNILLASGVFQCVENIFDLLKQYSLYMGGGRAYNYK